MILYFSFILKSSYLWNLNGCLNVAQQTVLGFKNVTVHNISMI